MIQQFEIYTYRPLTDKIKDIFQILPETEKLRELKIHLKKETLTTVLPDIHKAHEISTAISQKQSSPSLVLKRKMEKRSVSMEDIL